MNHAIVFAIFAVSMGLGATGLAQPAPDRGPNIVLIYCDDMGYGDLSCYGSKGAPTPNIDRLASQGARFTDFYVAQAVCSASRAAILTGCYNIRVGIQGALGPNSKIGINANELNLGKLAKQRGYATAIFGKWHLGHLPQFLPTRNGFDRWVGLPYSNDMWPRHPENPRGYPALPLFDQENVIKTNPEMDSLTGLYTTEAVKFIETNKDKPFFVYFPHTMPHVPLGAGPAFKGKSGHGLYGDVMSEIDWSVGQILETLKRLKLEDNTLVMFSSDNGPWTTYGDHAGSSGPLREAKGTSFDGGVRVPFIARWPGKIPAGKVCGELAMTIDVLPTMAHVLGVELPKDRVIDGRNMWPILAAGQRPADAHPLHEALYFYWGEHLQAVRMGKWKLHFPHGFRMAPEQRAAGGVPNKARQGKIELSLFDLENDIGETKNVADQNPEIVKKIETLAQKMREDLGDSALKMKGNGRREVGKAEPNN